MITESVAGVLKAVPEIGTYFFKTNDAGPGLCWSQWLYSGPNGPAFCRHRGMGERVRGLLDAINRGAEQADVRLDIHMSGNFEESERDDIARRLPENVTLLRRTQKTHSVGSGISRYYPLRGLFNPLDLLKQLQRLRDPELTTVFIDFRSSYDRGYERLDVVEKVVEVVDDFLKGPVYGTMPMLQRLRTWCDAWGGKDHGERLFEALVSMDEAVKYHRAAFPGFRLITTATSLRYLTRPLVAMPEKLSPQEESYFLPHVFNIHQSEARTDYVDTHGGRMAPSHSAGRGQDPRVRAVDGFRQMIDDVCSSLEDLDGAPEAAFFAKVAAALRVYASAMRSANNFYSMQVLRDRNADKLAAPESIPPKEGSWTGDADLLLMNEFMRDELDNAADLLELVENRGGMDCLCVARPEEEEDTFLLGANVAELLRKKMTIMRRHWLDATKHLATPHK